MRLTNLYLNFAPSIHGECDEKLLAIKALIYINSRLKKIPARIGKYFVYHADVLINGSSLGEELMILGYAKRIAKYELGKDIRRINWCKNIK